jgi:hypothetical protein
MDRIKYQYLLLLLIAISINVKSQNNTLNYLVCKIDTIYFDAQSAKIQNRKDSIKEVEENIYSMGFRNPYIMELKIIKNIENNVTKSNAKVRIWQHENPNFSLNNDNPFLFILNNPDSNKVFQVVDYYEVFKIWNGKWAEPTGVRNIKLNEPKKALFNYDLLKRKETEYYRVIKKLINCCKSEIENYYSNLSN